MPRFFALALIAGALLWTTGTPPPFILLAQFIVGTSLAGLIVSGAYVRAFMPLEWQAKRDAVSRLWRFVHLPRPAR